MEFWNRPQQITKKNPLKSAGILRYLEIFFFATKMKNS